MPGSRRRRRPCPLLDQVRALAGRARLCSSPKTAGVHVRNILRKLGVSGRVQAAALAQRAVLLPSAQR